MDLLLASYLSDLKLLERPLEAVTVTVFQIFLAYLLEAS
jgi:hypothetical protein